MERKPSKTYIKDGQRMMATSDGTMKMSRPFGKKMFGKHKGGKYSKPYVSKVEQS